MRADLTAKSVPSAPGVSWCASPHKKRSARRYCSVRLEELLEQPGAFRCQYSRSHLRAVIQLRVPKKVANRSGHSRFLVPRPEYHALHAGKDDRTGAHSARFERDVQAAVVETPAIELRGCFPYHQNLGMRRGILVTDCPVCRGRDDFPFIDDDRADRDLVAASRLAGEVQRIPYVLLVGRRCSRSCSKLRTPVGATSRQALVRRTC